jgi:hypothetical protein
MVFSLGGWSPLLPTRFHVPRGTQDTASVSVSFRLRACHPLRMSFPEHSAMIQCSYLRGPTTPTLQHNEQLVKGKKLKVKGLHCFRFLASRFLPFTFYFCSLCCKVGLGSSRFARRYLGNLA